MDDRDMYHLELFSGELLLQRLVENPTAAAVLSALGLMTKFRGSKFTVGRNLLARAACLGYADMDKALDWLERLGYVTVVHAEDEMLVEVHTKELAAGMTACVDWLRSVLIEVCGVDGADASALTSASPSAVQ